jgi:hypothetical protein
MADDTENLQVVLSVQDAGASAILADVRAKIHAIEVELGGMGAAGEKAGSQLSDAMQQAGQKANTVGGMFKGLHDDTKSTAGAFDELTQHSYLIARGLDAAGLAGGAAVTRIGALSDALRGLIAANPEILAVVAAIAVLVGTFEEFKKGTELAAEFQQSMVELKNAVQEQGDSWAAAQASVESWTSAMANAAGVTDTDAVGALNKLVEAGASWKDAEGELAIGAQMVAAGMGDWATVTHALYEAQSGEGMMLARLDPAQRTLIKNQADLQTVMLAIEKQTAKAITDDDTLTSAHNRLHAASDILAKQFGDSLLPALTWVEKGMIGVNIATDDLSTGIDNMIIGIVKGLAAGAASLEHFFASFADAARGDWKGAYEQQLAVISQNKAGVEAATQVQKGWNETVKGGSEMLHPQIAATQAYNKALKQLEDSLKNVEHLSHNPIMDQTKGGKGAGFTPPVLTDQIDQNKLDAAAQAENAATADKLAEAKDRAAIAEAGLTVSMKLATTVASQASAQASLDTQKIADLSEQYKILNESVYQETRMRDADRTSLSEATANYHAAQSALDRFNQAHRNAKDISESDKELQKVLTAAMQQYKAAVDDADHAVKSLSSSIRTHGEEAARDKAAMIDLADASSYASAEAQRSWGKFLTDEQTKLHDDLATFQMSNAQKVVYFANALGEMQSAAAANEALLKQYQQDELDAFKAGNLEKVASYEQAMAKISALIVQEYDLMKQYDQSELESYKSMLQDELNARKAVLEKEQQLTQRILDDILTEHKTFAQELKSVLDGMLKDYIASMSKLIFPTNQGLGPSTNPFAQFFSGFFGVDSGTNAQQSQAALPLTNAANKLSTVATGPQTSAATALSGSATQLDNAAAALSRSASTAGSGVGTIPTPSGPAIPTYTAGVDAQEWTSDFNAVSGSVPAVAGDIVSSYGGMPASGMVQFGWGPGSAQSLIDENMYSALENAPMVSPSDTSIPGITGGGASAASSALSKYGGYLMDALMGYMIGQSVNALENPNEMPGQSSGTWAGIFGGIGDVAGSIIGGPVGGMIGGLLGGLFGGLFGSHETAAQMPDVSEPTYGTQWNYGQFVSNMIGTYGTYNGQYIQAQAPYNQYEGGTPMGKQVYEELADLPKNLSPVVEGLANQLRALERGDTNSNALEIKSESQGMFTLESGAQISVQSYMQMIGQFMAATAGMLPTYTVSRAYPNFNNSTLTQTGMYDPTVSYGSGAQGVPPPPPVQGQPGYPGPNSQQSSRPIQVGPIIINGDVMDDKIPDEFALKVAQALARLGFGTAAGGLTHRMGTRVSGGDIVF